MDNDTNEPVARQPVHRRRTVGGLGRRAALTATALGLMSGAFAGGFIITHAATPTTAPSATATPATPSTATGTFKPNEDPTHEAGESAAREAQ
jgi:hypothetical protein